MGNVHVVQKLQTSMLVQMVNLDSSIYDYKFTVVSDNATLEYIYRGASNNTVTALLNTFQPNTAYIVFLYRTSKGGNSWGSYIHFTTTTTLARTEPAVSGYNPTYYPSVQNQMVYENGSYKGEAGSCVANCLSVVMDILAFRNRTGSPQNNYFSPSYIYGNRTRQTNLNTEPVGMYCNKTMEQINIDGVPVWSNVPENDNGYKTFPDNRFLTTGWNAGWGSAGQGAKPMFDGRTDTLDKQAKVNKMSFPISYTYNLSGNLYSGSYYSYSSAVDFAPFFDGAEIANRIQTYGYCAMNFHIANNFYSVPSSGLVPSPDYFVGAAHCSVIIGWTTISSKKYWICQNSWGSGWGNNGIFYIPMDYGATGSVITGPVDFGYGTVNWTWNWIYDMNVASHANANLPSTPSAPVADSIPRFSAGLNITWNPANDCNTYDIMYVEGGNTLYKYNINRSKTNLTSLKYGTTYSLSVRGVNYRGVSSWSSSNSMTTAPKTPSITSSSMDISNNRVSITIGNMEGNYSFFRIWYRNLTDGGGWNYIQVASTGSHLVSGLTPDKEYEFKVSSFYTVSGVDLESRDSIGNIGYSISVFYVLNVSNVKVYINSSWQKKPVKRWNGSAWVEGKVKYHNGSIWKQ